MVGRTDVGRGEFIGRRRRMGASLVLATCAIMIAGCTSGRVVTTEDASVTTQANAPASPPPSTHPTNDDLANAFDFYAQRDGRTGYYFTSPSKR